MRLRICHWLLLTSLSALALSTDGNAQQCDMSRKSVAFIVTMCNARGCSPGQERIDFVGSKVIHYSSAAQALGTVYYLGKTVDYCNSQLDTYRPALCVIQSGPSYAHGTASFVGDNLKLTLIQDVPQTQAQRAGKMTQFMHIFIPACTECRLEDLSIDSVLATGQLIFRSRMASSGGCNVLDTSTLPH
jgi:hypothetical protein